MARKRDQQSGQAAIELVAVLPFVLVAMLAVAQLATLGYALWSAADAARAGARAALVGGDAERAALSALPGWLEREALVEQAGPLKVTVAAPALVPGVPSIRVGAQAALDPQGGTAGG